MKLTQSLLRNVSVQLEKLQLDMKNQLRNVWLF
jgi:hypothetical protein